MSEQTITFYINDKAVEAKPKQTVMQAARQAGIYIPYFCWHPKLSLSGNCRICFVEIESERGNMLKPSCMTEVAPDMKIIIDSEKVLEHRKNVMGMILHNHPVDCGICDKAGECLLQDYHFSHNGEMSASIDAKSSFTKYHSLSERIVLDNERCILCSRCVRFTEEISGSNGLGIIGRGGHAMVREAPDDSFTSDAYSDNVIDLCPVGALLSKKFMYQSRVWYIQPTKSICPGCSNGCEVKVWHRKRDWKQNAPCAEDNQRIYRTTPLHQNIENRPNNPQLAEQVVEELSAENNQWICNTGRDYGDFYNSARANSALEKGKEISNEKAINSINKLISNSNKPCILVSNWASNEELQALQSALPEKVIRVFKNERVVSENEITEDKLLIRSDKNPNSAGVRKHITNLAETPPEDTDLIILWGVSQLGFDWASEQIKFTNNPKLVILSPNVNPENGHAEIFIPISLPTERNGHWTNHQGNEQKFKTCFTKDENVLDMEVLFNQLKCEDN